jgi:uncharacterized membrane protein YccC
LSVVFAHELDLANSWWAAISGFAVIQAGFAASARRGVQRIIGTMFGALAGTLVGAAFGNVPWLFVPALGLIGGVCIYRAIGADNGYAWILGGATAIMVLFEVHRLPTVGAIASFAMLRVGEVVVGTLACVCVAGVFHLGRRYVQKSDGEPGSKPQGAVSLSLEVASVRSARQRVACEGGVSISLLAGLSYVLDIPGFAQAMVTTVAVLILPGAMLADPTPRPVLERMVHRFTGCLLAGLAGVALLPLMGGREVPCLLALGLGVWTGCHVQTGTKGASYVGRQFVIAFIMVFVQDHHWSADPRPALQRLSGILTGIVILALVMMAASKLPIAHGKDATHEG